MYCSIPCSSAPYCAAGSSLGAVSSPLTALLSGTLHTVLEHIMWFRPYNPESGITVDLFVSGNWYSTVAAESFPTGEPCPHQLFIGNLTQPPNIATRILSNGIINTSSSSYGQCIIADPRRELLSWLSYNWTNASARHFIGDPSWPLSSFAEVFRGVSTSLDPEADQYDINMQDVTAKLQSANYQSAKYAGRGPCIRLDGSTGYISGTAACPAGAMSIGIRVRPRASISAVESVIGYRSGTSAGYRLIRTDLSNSIVFEVRNDSGTLFSVSSPVSTLSTYAWLDAWGVLDTGSMRISLYNGASPDVPLAQSAVSGTFNTVLSALAAGRYPDTASNFLAADIDEISIWSHALSSVEIAQWTGQRAPSGTAGLVYQYSMTEDTGGTTFESAGAGPNLTLNGGATWVDSLTGGVELQGKYVPKGRGIARQVAPVVLSSVDLIYQVSQTFDHIATDTLGPILEDGGIRVWTLKGVYPDPWAATPAPGEYMEIPTMGLIRLGSGPVKQLTCDVYLTSTTDLSTCITGILIGDGVLQSTEVDAGSLAALPSTLGVGYISGLAAVTVDLVLIQYLSSIFGWRAPNQYGALSFGVIAPPESLTPTAFPTGDDFALDGIRPVSTLPAAKSIIVQYKPYYQTQQPANVDVTLTEAAKQDLSLQYRSVTTPDNIVVLAADSTAATITVTTVLDSITDAQTQAALIAAWRSKPRRTDLLPYSDPLPKYVIGQVLLITMPILDYDQGKLVIVTAIVSDDANGQYSAEVTGELLNVGDSYLLVGDGTGFITVGDGTGTIIINN